MIVRLTKDLFKRTDIICAGIVCVTFFMLLRPDESQRHERTGDPEESVGALVERVRSLEAQVAALKSSKLDKSGGTISGELKVSGSVYIDGLFRAKQEARFVEVVLYDDAGNRNIRITSDGTILASGGHALVRAKHFQTLD